MRPTHLAFLLAIMVAGTACAQNPITNPSFEAGQGVPDAWMASDPACAWETTGHSGARCVSVEGATPEQQASWTQPGVPLTPGATYRFSCWARSEPGATGGCIVSGPDFCNNDTDAGPTWQRLSHVFVVPTDRDSAPVRVGHWYKQGKVLLDDVAIAPVLPTHRTSGGLTLGAGERVDGSRYRFEAPLSDEGHNYSRCLESCTAHFNTNRWVFGPGAQVTYRYALPGIELTSARVRLMVNWYASGDCLVEASRDGEDFIGLGRISSAVAGDFEVPSQMLPSPALWLRLRSPGVAEARPENSPGAFQVNQISVEAGLSATLPETVGATRYVDIETTDPRLTVAFDDLGDLTPGGRCQALVRLTNRSAQALPVTLTALAAPAAEGSATPAAVPVEATVPARGELVVAVPYAVEGTGERVLRLAIATAGDELFSARVPFSVPQLYASDYGYGLPGDAACELWWCEGTYKVSRQRPAPAAGSATPAVELSAARNEFEPVQIVLRPRQDLRGITATVPDLRQPGGARITADNVEVCSVAYHEVSRPTDREGCAGWWPDALPPLDRPLNLSAGGNQPLWITVKVPEDAAAGLYRGTVELRAEGWQASVPLELRVWDFTLPRESSVGSAFGLDPSAVWSYQNITREEDRERVWDLYLRNWRDHRIAPYSFWRRGIDVKFEGLQWTGGEVVADGAPEGTHCLKIVDEDATSAIAASAASPLPVDAGQPYVFSFMARTAEPGQQYQITFNSHDGAGQWISGHNLDVVFTGSGEWQRETLRFVPGDRSPDAHSLTLSLRAAPWTEDGSGKGTAWFDDLSLTLEGDAGNLLPSAGFEQDPGALEPQVGFAEWDKEARKCLDEYHFSTFALPVQGMGGGTFASRSYGQIGPYKQGTPEYRRAMKAYLSQVEAHLREKGWLDKAFVYWFDEPEPKDYDFVREGMEELKLAAPGIRRMLTEEPNEALFGSVDIWCPVLSNHNAEDCAARQQAGESIWWYVCTGPQAPWPGLFMDHGATDLRVWLWMTWKWNVEAVLVWASNYWTSYCAYTDKPQDPWKDPMSYVSGYGLPPGHIGYWGNGDGRFLYPPRPAGDDPTAPVLSGPVNSIRWEMLREGIEDFEYFKLLEGLVARTGDNAARALLAVPGQIVAGQTEFTHDPQPIYRHRAAMARAIEELSR